MNHHEYYRESIYDPRPMTIPDFRMYRDVAAIKPTAKSDKEKQVDAIMDSFTMPEPKREPCAFCGGYHL